MYEEKMRVPPCDRKTIFRPTMTIAVDLGRKTTKQTKGGLYGPWAGEN